MLLSELFQTKSRDSAVAATTQLLRRLKVPVTGTTVQSVLERHPDHPSLYSISSSLRQWQVEQTALEITAEELQLLPPPFIVHLPSGKGRFQLVTTVSKEKIGLLDAAGRTRTQQLPDFYRDWKGVVLLAEAGAESGEKDFIQQRKREKISKARLPFLLSISFLLMILFASSQPPAVRLTATSALLLKFCGLMVSILLLLVDMNARNPLLQQICTSGKRSGCSALLGARGARPLPWLSWSEVGFCYFSGGFLWLLIDPAQAPLLLGWLGMAALPYILFSVYYQWRVARQWCRLCLAVQAILLLEAINFIFVYPYTLASPGGSLPVVMGALAAFLVPAVFWMIAGPALREALQAGNYRRTADRLRYDPVVFRALLHRQKKVDIPEDLGITTGNSAARHTLVKVCNPYCGPCARVHAEVEALLRHHPELRIQIIFTATNEPDDERAAPVRQLMACYQQDAGAIEAALHDWYTNGKNDLAGFIERHPAIPGPAEDLQLERMSQWCRAAGITATPTFFLDGHQLPEGYRIEHLQSLLY